MKRELILGLSIVASWTSAYAVDSTDMRRAMDAYKGCLEDAARTAVKSAEGDISADAALDACAKSRAALSAILPVDERDAILANWEASFRVVKNELAKGKRLEPGQP